jgi:8-oxo-dGTP diphosphatase
MPHIHTQPNQHDMTVSMYIIRKVDDEWKCLIHMHRRLGVLMQIGGHIETDETPWQTVAHELTEESGYTLAELEVLQPSRVRQVRGAVVHPVPCLVNTHNAGPGPHYHSDLCYVFVAKDIAKQVPSEGESDDIRWMTIAEMKHDASHKVLGDVIDIYETIVEEFADSYLLVPASEYSLTKPSDHFGFYNTN